jgi:activator of HSP90 ATPase
MNAGNLNRRQWISRAAIGTGSLILTSASMQAHTEDTLSHAAEAIHQEVFFKASPKRVYEALTDAQQFQKVQQLSAAMKSVDVSTNPAVIARDLGSAFSLFGGYVQGRQIELVPDKRIVQAWRAMSWDPGIYSIVRFELSEQGTGTKLVFDHTGFPAGTGEHLAAGWKANYWEPLEKFLA